MSANAKRAELVLITGLSGSGKSSVAKCLEDLGYYTVDNLPLPLLRRFLADPVQLIDGSNDHLAVVTDVRAPGFAEEFPKLMGEIDREKVKPTLIFLESSDEALVRRFSETRRPHPLAQDGTFIEGIQRERDLLSALPGLADMIIDTSEWTIHQVRNHIYREIAAVPDAAPEMVVSMVSFGFKHGIPYGTDLLFDVRFLPNPHFVPGLRERTGVEAPVQDFLQDQPAFREFARRLEEFLLFLLPQYRQENRSYLSIAIGCTGGKHRSVALCQHLAGRLEAAGFQPVRTIHRDIAR